MSNTLLRSKFSNIFEEDLLIQIEQKGKLTTLHEGDEFLSIGNLVKVVPLLLEGSFKVSRNDEEGRELLLYVVRESESCAMSFTCCMEQFPSEIKAVAEEDCTLILIPIQVMDEWMMKYVTWKSFVMRTIRYRFQEMMKTIDQLAFLNLDQRLEKYLNDKISTSHSKLINLSHQQIADELATSRVVISRLLKKMETEGKVLLFRNQIKMMK